MVLLRELFYPTKQKKAHFKLRPIYATISIASENNNNNDKRWSFVIVTLSAKCYTPIISSASFIHSADT